MSYIINPYLFATGGGGGFGPDPSTVADLQFWNDTYQETGFSNGNQMSAVQDFSGNNRDGTGVSGGGSLPVYRATDGPNSMPCIRYGVNSGAAGYFTLPNFLTGFTAGHGFAICKTVLRDGSQPFSSWGSTDDGYYPWSANNLMYDPTATNARKDAIAAGPLVMSGAGGTPWHLYEFRSASGAWSLWQNGAQTYSTGSNTVAWGTTPTIGKELGPGRMFIGDIAELFMYSSIKSGADLTTILSYLNTKYTLGIGRPYVLTVTPSATVLNNFSGCIGFKFNTPSGVTPTVTQLGRWKIAGNSGTHSVKLYNSGGVVRTASVDLTTGSSGSYVYAPITPITLSASTAYWILSEETNGGDQWYDGDTTITVDSTAGTLDASSSATQSGCTGVINGFYGPNTSYVPTNFKFYI